MEPGLFVGEAGEDHGSCLPGGGTFAPQSSQITVCFLLLTGTVMFRPHFGQTRFAGSMEVIKLISSGFIRGGSFYSSVKPL
jgi:hypothetical protein